MLFGSGKNINIYCNYFKQEMILPNPNKTVWIFIIMLAMLSCEKYDNRKNSKNGKKKNIFEGNIVFTHTGRGDNRIYFNFNAKWE